MSKPLDESKADEQDDFDDEPPDHPDAALPHFDEIYKRLESRVGAAGLEITQHQIPDLDVIKIEINFPSGREKRTVALSPERASELLALPFEYVRFIDSFDAIYSHAEGWIECIVTPPRFSPLPVAFLFRRIFADRTISLDDLPTLTLESPDGVVIQFGPASSLARLLIGERPRAHPLSFRISGVALNTHDATELALITAANAFFFNLDANHGMPLALSRTRLRTPGRIASRRPQDQVVFPISKFDPEPISLYLYARSARGMPLLQFLAYYQSIEFYFEYFSRQDAVGRIATLIRDPTFSPHSDRDISQLLSAVQTGRSALGTERTQLTTTLVSATHSDDIRSFFDDMPDESREFFSRKSPLTSIKIPLANANADLRESVAERIYDIRCKVVHTKESGQGEIQMVLPYSKEEDLLVHDLELLAFLARRIIAARSQPFSL